ncbi:MAG: 30S ribosomal protein S16 [Planctomycetota bacterium]
MAVAIRLKRLGRKRRPFYRIDAMERRNARGGKSLETLGFYDPLVEDPAKGVKLRVDRIQFWLDRGARPSETVTSFFRKADLKWGNPDRKSRKSLWRERTRELRQEKAKEATRAAAKAAGGKKKPATKKTGATKPTRKAEKK